MNEVLWFIAGITVGTFFGIGVAVVFAWQVLRALVRFALVVQENRRRGGPNTGATV